MYFHSWSVLSCLIFVTPKKNHRQNNLFSGIYKVAVVLLCSSSKCLKNVVSFHAPGRLRVFAKDSETNKNRIFFGWLKTYLIHFVLLKNTSKFQDISINQFYYINICKRHRYLISRNKLELCFDCIYSQSNVHKHVYSLYKKNRKANEKGT